MSTNLIFYCRPIIVNSYRPTRHNSTAELSHVGRCELAIAHRHRRHYHGTINVTSFLRSSDSVYADRCALFSARCNIYISRLMLRCQCPSVCPSVCDVCIVVTGCNGSRIPLHAWIDGCLCYLQSDNASPGSSDVMMPVFLVEEGRGHLALC